MPDQTRAGRRHPSGSAHEFALAGRDRPPCRRSRRSGQGSSRQLIDMLPRLVLRTLRSADKRCLWKFTWNFGVKGLLSVEKFKRRIKKGEYFPPFLYLSINSACNLRCQV